MGKQYVTSIHGRRIGLDSDSNLIVDKGDGGQAILSPGVSAASTASNIPAYGVTTLSTAISSYTLDDPIPGVRKTIIAANPSTATGRFVQTSTANGVTFASTGSFNKWQSTASQSLELVGISTLQYAVLSNAAASTLTTDVSAFSTI